MTDEDVQLKAGHAPALKVGGARVVTRHKTTSVLEEPRLVESEGEEEEQAKPVKEKNPQLVMWGQVRDPAKDYPSEAIQHMQHKPAPTRQADTKPNAVRPNNIQQPRKC